MLPDGRFSTLPFKQLRIATACLLLPVVVVALLATGLLWRMRQAPLDITPIARHWLPIPIAPGQDRHRPAGRLTWARVTVAWRPDHHTPALAVTFQNLRVLRRDGSAAVSVRDGEVVAALSSLVSGRIAPVALTVGDAAITLRRAHDGTVTLDLPGARREGSDVGPISLTHLRRVAARNVVVSAFLPDHDVPLKIAVPSVDARRDRRSARHLLWEGSASATLVAPDGQGVTFDGKAVAVPQGVSWHLASSPLVPAHFAYLSAGLARWCVPVSMDVGGLETEGRVGGIFRRRDGLAIAQINGVFRAGAGEILQEGGTSLAVTGGGGAFSVAPTRPGERDARVALSSVWLGLAGAGAVPTRFSGSAQLHLSDVMLPKGLSGVAHVDGSSFELAQLGAIWPLKLAAGARRWAAHNLLQGEGSGLAITARLKGDRGWASLRPVALKGALHLVDTRVRWMKGMPPARKVTADLSFDKPDVLHIAVHDGQQPVDESAGAALLDISDGTALIDGLYDRDQNGSFALHLKGDLGAYIALLAQPSLHLLSKHPFPFAAPTGDVSAFMSLQIPLEDKIPDEAIHLNASARFSGVHLGGVVLGRSVDAASGTATATTHAMDVIGAGQLGGVPTQVRFHQAFDDVPTGAETARVHAESTLDPASVRRAALGPSGLFTGEAQLTSDYVALKGGRARVQLALDMTAAALDLPLWRKPAGVPATASGRIELQDGAVQALGGMKADGPGLSMRAHAVIRNSKIAGLAIDGFRIGRSSGDAQILFPAASGGPMRVSVIAQTLDLGPLFDDRPSGGAVASATKRKNTASRPQSWKVNLRAARLFVGPRSSLGQVSAHLEDEAGHLTVLSLDAATPAVLKATLQPVGKRRHLVASVQDFGALMSGLNITSRLGGGVVRLDGMVGVPASATGLAFTGRLTGRDVAFLSPPTALTAASRLAIFQHDQADRHHFEIQSLSIPIVLKDKILTIKDGTLGNRALGATFRGKIGISAETIDMRGTLVPLFALNAMPGKLPGVVGSLLVPEKGGGVLAATFTAKGSLSDPHIAVNPFAALLPGVLRNLAK